MSGPCMQKYWGQFYNFKIYRLVNVVFAISKVFEKFGNKRIFDPLEKCSLFSNFQSGFRFLNQLQIF